MQSMTRHEAQKWCSQDATGLQVTSEDILRYDGADEHKFFVAAPPEYYKIVVLTRAILLFAGEAGFSGGFIWLQRWDIGSPQLVRVGWRILEDIRRAHGDSRSLEIAPAQLFRDDELVELHAFLAQAVGFGWLADYVACTGKFFVHFKTNGQICFTAKSAETLQTLRTSFQEWNPTDEDPMVLRMKS